MTQHPSRRDRHRAERRVRNRLAAVLSVLVLGGIGAGVAVAVSPATADEAVPASASSPEVSGGPVVASTSPTPVASGSASASPTPTPTPTATKAPGPNRITVGEVNANSISSSKHFTTRDRWQARAPRLAKTILASHPDLLLTAELTATRIDASCVCHPHAAHPTWPCTTQATQLWGLLRKTSHPYAMATSDSLKAVSQLAEKHDWGGRITDGTQIFYDPRKMTLLSHGYVSPHFTLHVALPSGVGDRLLVWARFRLKASPHREFLAVAAHMQAGQSSSVIALRAAIAKKAVPYFDAKAGKLPIVFGGDLNADPKQNRNPAVTILTKHGYVDAALKASHRVGAHWTTFNGGNGHDGADPGYPRTVHPHRGYAGRIDFILVKRSPHVYRYENVMHLRKGSTSILATSYQGTDHLMQLATVGIS